MTTNREFGAPYTNDFLARVAFPLGGIGAGMMCLEGTGAFSHVSLRHSPEVFHEPLMFAALSVRGDQPVARVIEGQVPKWKAFGPAGAGNGSNVRHHGLPRYRTAEFSARFPFAKVALEDDAMPICAEITGWSPFTPGDSDSSSLPAALLEYRLTNTSDDVVDAVFSFHTANFMAAGDGPRGVREIDGGFALWQQGSDTEPWREGSFAVTTDAEAAVDCQWFRGGWFDALTIVWRHIAEAALVAHGAYGEGAPSGGGSLYVPVLLQPGESTTIPLRLSWYVPTSNLRIGATNDTQCGDACCCEQPKSEPIATYIPWYASRFDSVDAVNAYIAAHYDDLRARSALFSDTLFDTTLPDEVMEAVSSNLAILKSPTVLRQHDGRLWCYEGCCDGNGCCHGSCTHVWNYAQAIAHLFPDLERSLRATEFIECQDERGHQGFRANLPISPLADHSFHAAADGQLGGILKAYREWRVSGDTEWLRGLWPRIKRSLDYCMQTWDPDREGWLVEPHHNTYDIEFWGPDGMCTSIYLGALVAGQQMAMALGVDASAYGELAQRARIKLEHDLYNGEYFYQKVRWEDLKAGNPVTASATSFGGDYSPEAVELMQREGPKYQYGTGCLSDGVLGEWLSDVCGIGTGLSPEKVKSHLLSVYTHNLRHELIAHANPQRPSYALGDEGGLLLCTWPRGGALTLPFVYSDEVWTGIEYQVASHLIRVGCVEQGLELVRTVRQRYDGRVRNPFNEYECGHWYARALSSYALLFALTGARYDAVDQVLHLSPRMEGDFRAFLCTASGYGVVGMRDGQPFLEVKSGSIPVKSIRVATVVEGNAQ